MNYTPKQAELVRAALDDVERAASNAKRLVYQCDQQQAITAIMERHKLSRLDVARLLGMPMQDGGKRCATMDAYMVPPDSSNSRTIPEDFVDRLAAAVKEKPGQK